MEWPIYFMYGCGYVYCDMNHECLLLQYLLIIIFSIINILFFTRLVFGISFSGIVH